MIWATSAYSCIATASGQADEITYLHPASAAIGTAFPLHAGMQMHELPHQIRCLSCCQASAPIIPVTRVCELLLPYSQAPAVAANITKSCICDAGWG